MTQDELDRLEALANAATPGPWVWSGAQDDNDKLTGGGLAACTCEWGDHRTEAIIRTDMGAYGPCEPDRAFIAAARDAVPALVVEVRRLRGLVEAAYLEGNRDRLPEGDAELADIQWARSDAREALGGA